MNKSNPKIYKKLLNVMKTINSIKKDGYNEHNQYSYATEANIKTIVRKELIKNGLIFKHEITEARTKGDIIQNKVNVLVSIKVKYSFIDVETGESYNGEYYGHGADMGDKGLYKAITGSIKYILTSTFLIPTGDDPEDEKEPFKGNEYANTAKNIQISQPTDMEQLKSTLHKLGGDSESSALLLLGDKTGLKFDKFSGMTKSQTANALKLLNKKLNK